jgi:hypothetical protein
MPRKQHFHCVVEVVPSRSRVGKADRTRYRGTTKSEALKLAQVERDVGLPFGHTKEISLERCEPPCDYDTLTDGRAT